MYYLIPLPIVFIAVFIKCICVRFKLKIFNGVCNVIIALGSAWFIYEFLKYNNFDIVEEVIKLFKYMPEIHIKNI